MRTSHLILSCLLLVVSIFWDVPCSADGVSIKLHVKKRLVKQGEDVEIRCQSHRKHPSDLTQIIKSRVVFMSNDETYNTTIEGPFDVCNGTWLNPAIYEVTGRYRVTKETSGNLFVRITKALPEDGGSWQCRVLSDSEGLLAESELVEVSVVGPMRSVSLLSSHGGRNFTQIPSEGASVTLQTNKKGRLGCEVKVTNVAPKVTLTLEKEGKEVKDVSDRFMHEENTLIINSEGGLVNVQRHIRYTEMTPLGHLYNKHIFRCRAELPFYEPMEANTLLNITFAPDELSCQPRIVDGTEPVKLVPLICHVRANPVPTLTWIYPNGTTLTTEHPDVDMQVNGDLVTTILTLHEVDPAQFGTYKLKANNYYGSKQAQLMLTDHLGTGGQESKFTLNSLFIISTFLYIFFSIV